MFTLITDKSKYFRVKRRQGAAEIENEFNIPVQGQIFAGRIIFVGEKNLRHYVAEVGDTYRTIALKFGVNETELKEINGFKPVYPTCKLFVPLN